MISGVPTAIIRLTESEELPYSFVRKMIAVVSQLTTSLVNSLYLDIFVRIWISKPEFWEMNLTIKLAVFFPGMLLVAPLALPPEVDSIKFTKHVKHSFFDSTFLTLGFWMYDLDIGSWHSGHLQLVLS